MFFHKKKLQSADQNIICVIFLQGSGRQKMYETIEVAGFGNCFRRAGLKYKQTLQLFSVKFQLHRSKI